MAAARTRSGKVALRMVPSRISRCASGRQPKSCRNDGSSRLEPCSTTISPARKRMLPSRCFNRSPWRLTASRLTLWLLNSASRCADMPTSGEPLPITASTASISAPAFSLEDGERSPEIFSLACETMRSSASGPPSSSSTSSASSLMSGNGATCSPRRKTAVTTAPPSPILTRWLSDLPMTGEPAATTASEV
ncbi:hypothetical protein FQZ97_989320 [compost metagenome]